VQNITAGLVAGKLIIVTIGRLVVVGTDCFLGDSIIMSIGGFIVGTAVVPWE